MEHEKIVDGIKIKYLCQPCPECKAKLEQYESWEIGLYGLRETKQKAKLEAAEEMAGVCQRIKDHADLNIAFSFGSPRPLYNDLVFALTAWEKAGKGEG